jgi:hypothetical protein
MSRDPAKDQDKVRFGEDFEVDLRAYEFPSLRGTCGTGHDTANVGNHSFPTPLTSTMSLRFAKFSRDVNCGFRK